ncbi:MAG: nuclear transport factor 2 family protein [Xanthomonadales bacterium]|nr:nuclear transport factor 2 family protein [Xanthomonadales bacterium]NNK33088.1 nuclear transport factor 2 family protein [Xanthomonadales bacterium]
MLRALAIIAGLLACCAVADASEHSGNSDEEILRHFKLVLWPQAYHTQDTELLDRLLHASFQMINDDGSRSTKAEEMAWVAENAFNPGNFEYRIERLDIYEGRLAIIDGTGITERYRYHSSNVLIKENGAWKAVASHVSGYRETAAPE